MTECWNWQRSKATNGYGKLQLGGKEKVAHRVAYEAFRGPIPEGLVTDHLCRNKACVNPWHLEVVTSRENTLRGVGVTAENAKKTHCYRGHEFAGENLHWYGNRRRCMACWRVDNKILREKRKQKKLLLN